MPVPLRRHTSLTSIVAAAAAFVLLAPAANAATSDPLANLKLDSATYTLTIKTSRCPTAGDPNASTCGHLDVDSAFTTQHSPKVSKTKGTSGFADGIRIFGSGNSLCSSESPSTDPMLGSAVAADNTQIRSTRVFVSSDRRGARWAWPGPSTLSPPCTYAYGDGTLKYPEMATTQFFPASALKKRRVDVIIEATGNKFTANEPDGTVVYGEASWKLTLSYKRQAARK